MSDDRYRSVTVFDRLLAELGVPHGQFAAELSRFELSPREWLEARLRAAGWMKRSEVEASACGRACCR